MGRVRTALVRRGRSPQDADDLLQEAWLRFACYETHRDVLRPEAFIMRTALNLAVDAHRRGKQRGDEVAIDEVVLIDFSPSVEEVLLGRERAARLGVCLGRLNERTRQIFLAHRLEGLTYCQIASEHRLSVSSVEKHVAKALLQIATWMEDW